MERWRARIASAVDVVASGEAASRYGGLDPAALNQAVHFVDETGTVSRGARAVFEALSRSSRGIDGAWLAFYRASPPFRAVAERAYEFVAARRPLFSRLTRLLWGASPSPAPIDGAARAWLIALGACYFIAFISLGLQVRGLIGLRGLEPAVEILAAARRLGPLRFWEIPSLAWLSASDAALVGGCVGGAIASLFLASGVAEGPAALICWGLYLSLCAVGGEFMNFQWDALLLEAGLLAVFLARWRRGSRASPGAFFLTRILLAKLMLESGLVKIFGGDPTWRDLTAPAFHHWTQPLPGPAAWWFARLPLIIHQSSCLAMYAVELGAPLFLLGPRNARRIGATAIVVLMAVVAVSGNYGIFNLLTAALALTALDDSLSVMARLAPRPAAAPRTTRRFAGLAAVYLALSLAQGLDRFGIELPPAFLWSGALSVAAPLRSINSYGLFTVMTKFRDEITLEVSLDGVDWRVWPFRWKPDDPRRAPPIVAPHMPRLDWQMWFAALGAPSPWFNRLAQLLLEGGSPAESLLGPSPLGGKKPRFIRASMWSTRFSSATERRAQGIWWVRERRGICFGPISETEDIR